MPHQMPHGNRARRPRPVRLLGRWLRLVVLLLAVVGLTPLAQAVDLVELAVGSHPVEAVAGDACGSERQDDCEKSGCHAGVHHCGCCAPMPRAVLEGPLSIAWPDDTPTWQRARARAPPSEGEAPPRQPPRA